MSRLEPPDSSFLFPSSVISSKTLRSEQGKQTKKNKKIKTNFLDTFSSNNEINESNSISSLENLPKEEALQQLLDDVYSLGDILKENPFPDAIINYKKAVKSFLQFVVQNSYEVHEQISGRNILKRKKFIQLEIIDQKLDKLAAEIISTQKDQLKILARIEEINGMLVNLIR